MCIILLLKFLVRLRVRVQWRNDGVAAAPSDGGGGPGWLCYATARVRYCLLSLKTVVVAVVFSEFCRSCCSLDGRNMRMSESPRNGQFPAKTVPAAKCGQSRNTRRL